MNWMRISMVALMLTLLTAVAVPAFAETAEPGSAGGAVIAEPSQPALSKDNPYLKEIEAAEKAVSDSLAKLYALQQQDPFNFDAQMDAYYVYLKAESTLRLLKQKAQEWEKANMPSFKGRVLAFEKDIPIRIMDSDPDQTATTATATASGTDEIERMVAPEALSQAKPVVGAVVVLQPMLVAAAQKVTNRKDDRRMLRKNPLRTETGPKGEFDMPGLKAGAYSVSVAKKGYEVWRGRIEVPARGEVKRTIYLVKYRMLMGTVKGLKGIIKLPIISKPFRQTVPLADAAVYLRSLPTIYRTTAVAEEPGNGPAVVNENQAGTTDQIAFVPKTKTNKLGHYEFRGLKIGRYEMTVFKDGFQQFKGTLYVTKVVQTQNIVLMPKLPTPPPTTTTTRPAQEVPMDTPTGASLDQPFDN